MTRHSAVVALILASGSVLFGQLESNSITITASRSVYLQPDEIVFGVSVNSGPDSTLDEIVAALDSLGITADNFRYVSPFESFGLQWNFNLPSPFSRMKATISALTALQQTLGQKNTGLNLTFSVNYSQVSAESRQCASADLVADARIQAQKLAAAAGLTLGPLLAIAEPQFSPALYLALPAAQYVFGIPLAKVNTSPAVICSSVIKFALLRYAVPYSR